MENSIFENFNYGIIDSSVAHHKEVMVTYSYQGKSIRQFFFIKEVRNKNDAYYINEAKKIVDQKMKSGELVKTSNKLIKKVKHGKHVRTSVKKPILIATSCVLAAGALGTGGYFLGSYLGGGGGKPLEGYTVVLQAGEGVFNNGKNYLILPGVKKGTALGDVEGYMIPTYENYDFDKWTYEGLIGPGESLKVTTDLILTATYYEGISYTRDTEKNKMSTTLNKLIEDHPDIETNLRAVYDKTITAINDRSIDDNKNGVKTVIELSQFANDTMNLLAKYEDNTELVKAIVDVYVEDIDDLLQTERDAIRFALAKIYSAYLKALTKLNGVPIEKTLLDTAFNDAKDRILNNYPEGSEDMLLLYSYFASGAELLGAALTDSKPYNTLVETYIRYETNIVKGKLVKKGDTATIEWLGELFYAYPACLGNFYKDESYTQYIEKLYQRANGYINDVFAGMATEFNIGRTSIISATMKTLADIDVTDYHYFPEAKMFFDSLSTCDQLFSNVINNYYPDGSGSPGYSGPYSYAELISKMVEAYKDALTAFAIYPGNDAVDFQTLFSFSTGSSYEAMARGLLQMTFMTNSQLTSSAMAYFYDAFAYSLKTAIKFAQNEDKEHFTYQKILENMTPFATYVMQSVGVKCKEYAPYANEIIKNILDIMTTSTYSYSTDEDSPAISAVFEMAFADERASLKTVPYSVKIITGVFKGANSLYTSYPEIDAVLIPEFYKRCSNELLSVPLIAELVNENSIATDMTADFIIKTCSEYCLPLFEIAKCIQPDPKATFGAMLDFIMRFSFIARTMVSADYTSDKFEAFYDVYEAILDKLPNLIRQDKALTGALFNTLLEFIGEDGQEEKTFGWYFKEHFDLADELKEAIQTNFVDGITKEVEDLKPLVKATQQACDAIIAQ